MPQVGEQPALVDEFADGAVFGNGTVFEHHNSVGDGHQRGAVRHNHHGAVTPQPAQGLNYCLFVGGIEGGCCLIDQQQAGVFGQCPSESNTLTLAAGQRAPAFADGGIPAVWQLVKNVNKLHLIGNAV